MHLFLSIITDLLFVLCIFLVCNNFIMLDKTEHKYRYILSAVIIVFSTIVIFYSSNIHIDIVITVIAVIIAVLLCFNDSKRKKILVSIWSHIVISLFSLIVQMGIDTLFSLVNIEQEGLLGFVSITVVLIFIIFVKQLLQRKNKDGLKNIKIRYLVLYTILMLIDEMTMTMMAAVTMEEMITKNKIYYGLSSFLMATAIFIQLGAVIMLMVSRDMYKEKEEITHKYLNEQQEHYTYLEEREKETKKFRHDINFHMFILEELRNKSNDEYNEYLGEVIERVERLRKKLSVYNDVVDAILYKFYDIAEENNIKFTVTGHMPPVCYIETYDLCSIFYNLLNNAVEASGKVDKKEIEVDVSYSDEDIIIIIKNYFDGKIKTEDNEILTGKHDKNLHGWGMQNVKDSVNKYNGIMDIEIDNNIFSVTILLKNVIKEIL